jgi:hypothetical protein
LDPEGVNGAPEIVKVTAHTAAATSVTVTRAQQGTTARAHPVSSVWVHALTETDIGEFLKVVTTANITDLNVTTGKIADLAVTAGKLAADAVTTAKILDLNVTTGKLAADAVTTAKILDGNVTMAKLSAGVQADITEQRDRLACALTHSAGQSIADSTSTALTFDTETFDTGGLHSGGAATRITVPTGGAGLWQFSFHVGFPANAAGARSAWLQLNASSADRRGFVAMEGSGLASGYLNTTHLARLSDGDYMQVVVNQTSGGALNVQGSDTADGVLQFAAVRLGD